MPSSRSTAASARRSEGAAVAYDAELADRVRALLALRGGVVKRRMFGGLAFLVDGQLAVAVSGRGGLMVRTNPAEAERLRERPEVGPVVMRGRETAGWLRVDAEALNAGSALREWVERGLTRVAELGKG